MNKKQTVIAMAISSLVFALFWLGHYLIMGTIPHVKYVTVGQVKYELLMPFSRAVDAFVSPLFVLIFSVILAKSNKSTWTYIFPIGGAILAFILCSSLVKIDLPKTFPVGIIGTGLFIFFGRHRYFFC